MSISLQSLRSLNRMAGLTRFAAQVPRACSVHSPTISSIAAKSFLDKPHIPTIFIKGVQTDPLEPDVVHLLSSSFKKLNIEDPKKTSLQTAEKVEELKSGFFVNASQNATKSFTVATIETGVRAGGCPQEISKFLETQKEKGVEAAIVEAVETNKSLESILERALSESVSDLPYSFLIRAGVEIVIVSIQGPNLNEIAKKSLDATCKAGLRYGSFAAGSALVLTALPSSITTGTTLMPMATTAFSTVALSYLINKTIKAIGSHVYKCYQSKDLMEAKRLEETVKNPTLTREPFFSEKELLVEELPDLFPQRITYVCIHFRNKESPLKKIF